MIDLIKKKIIDIVPDFKDFKIEDISVLKYCTPSSGINPGGKVIFLVFKKNDKDPVLCVKTVRKIEDNEVIIKAYDNLNKLHDLVVGTSFEKMFPAPVILAENEQGMSFSIETACLGRRAESDDYLIIVKKYIEFQSHISKIENKENVLAGDYFDQLLDLINLDSNSRDKIRNYFQSKFALDSKLCLVSQHGDLTFDNILIYGDKINIFDCERFGVIDLAGFDLFHFLQKKEMSKFIESHQNIFNDYFKEINCDLRLSPILIFLYYLNEVRIKSVFTTKDINADFIIRNFEKFL